MKKKVLMIGSVVIVICVVIIMIIVFPFQKETMQDKIIGTFVSQENQENKIIITKDEIEFVNIPFERYEKDNVQGMLGLEEHNQGRKLSDDEKKKFVDDLQEAIKWEKLIDSKVKYRYEYQEELQEIWISTDTGSEKEFYIGYDLKGKFLNLGEDEKYIKIED